MKSKILAILAGTMLGPAIIVACSRASPKMALAAVVGAFVALAIVGFPAIGLLLTSFMIPLERFGRFTDDSSLFTISLMRIVGILTVAGWCYLILNRKQKPQLGYLFWLYLAYVFWGIASAFHSTDFDESLRASGQLVSNLLFFMVVITLTRDFTMTKNCAALWLLATFLIGMYTIYDWHLGSNFTSGSPDEGLTTDDRWNAVGLDQNEWQSFDVAPRAIGSTTHSAVYGINLILSVPFIIFFLKQSQNYWLKFAATTTLLVVSYNILLTNTRSVMLVYAMALGLCWFRGLLIIRRPVLFAGAMAACCVLVTVDISDFRRVLDPSNYTYENSQTLRSRIQYWNAGFAVISENWLIGVGMANENEIPKHLTDSWIAERTSVHNEYIQTMMELGIIGFLLFFTFVIRLLSDSVQSAKIFRANQQDDLYWFAIACQIAMIMTLIYGIQCDVFRFPLKGWWFAAGSTVVLHRFAVTTMRSPSTTISPRFSPRISPEGI